MQGTGNWQNVQRIGMAMWLPEVWMGARTVTN